MPTYEVKLTSMTSPSPKRTPGNPIASPTDALTQSLSFSQFNEP